MYSKVFYIFIHTLALYLINLISTQSTPLLPPPPTPSPTIQSLNCTKFSTSKQYWITFKGKQTDPFNNGINSCFYFYDHARSVSWHEARDMCQDMNATLLSIHNYTMNYLLSHRLTTKTTNGKYFWIGLNSLTKRGLYKWTDNTPLDFANFSSKTSSGDPLPINYLDQGRCVSFSSIENTSYVNKLDQGYWFKEDCNQNHPFVCEKKMDTSVPPTEPPPQGGCPQDWYQYSNKKCVKYFNQSLNFNESRAKCVAQNWELLSIHSEDEQNFITILMSDKPPAFIGYHRPNFYSSWLWDDQSNTNYDNWAPMQSFGNSYSSLCTIVSNSTQTGKWQTVTCLQNYSVICEKSLDPSILSSGIRLESNKCQISGFDKYVQYKNSCYSLIDSTLHTFADAEQSCNNDHAHLVSIVSPTEEAFISYYIKQLGKADTYWIGLQSKIEGDVNVTQLFEWTDEWPIYYTNWNQNEPQYAGLPQEECVTFNKTSGKWKTTACDKGFPYICKTTTDSLPKMNSNKSGVCPKLNNITDKSLIWVDIDRRSQFCYWFSADEKGDTNSIGLLSWTDASFHCHRRNGTLVSIHSNHDLLLMKNKLTQDFYNTWIGLSRDLNGDYMWEDGTPLDYTNWDPDENIVFDHNNIHSGTQCIEVDRLTQMWKQQSCSGYHRNYFVCAAKKIYTKSTVTQNPTISTIGSTNNMKIGSTHPQSSMTTTTSQLKTTTQTTNIGGKQNSNKPDDGLSGGAKAGIAFGVILGVLVICGVGFFLMKIYRPNSPIINSFENSLYASRRSNRRQKEIDQVVTYTRD